MKTIVVKYGGSSLRSIDRIKAAAVRIAEEALKGYRVAAVVSAMGDTTDRLISKAKLMSDMPRSRELGLLLSTGEVVSSSLMAMALQSLGIKATALNGAQCGIETDSVFDNAKIENINTTYIENILDKGEVAVVAGFQGKNENEVTVLGRGGSDTTAAALTAALKAQECRIYTDVEGVYTADPRIVADASLLSGITYEEMIELASSGAQVMMGRSVEIARKHGFEINVVSSTGFMPGTIITREENLEKTVVTGITVNKNVVMIHLYGLKSGSDDSSAILSRIADEKINIIIMLLNRALNGTNNLSIIINPEDLARALNILDDLLTEKRFKNFRAEKEIALLAVVGSGIAGTWGVVSNLFKTLSRNNIEVFMSSTSEIKITAVIPKQNANKAVNVLHTAFELSKLSRKFVGEPV